MRSGSVLLSAHGRPLGGGVLGPGGLVGIPDLVEASEGLLADNVRDPLRPTGSSSSTRIKAQAGAEGARVLRWTAKEFRRAVDAEKDPKVQAQLVFYLNQQLLKKLHSRDHGVARKEYSNLLRAALSLGHVEATDRAALHQFRAKVGVTEGDHAACLEALGWSVEAFDVGVRLDVEGTTSALRALVAKAYPKLKPAAPLAASAGAAASAGSAAAATAKAPVPALAAAADAKAANAAAIVVAAATADVLEDERRRVAQSKIAGLVKRKANAAKPPERPPLLRRLAPSWASPQKRQSSSRRLAKDASKRTLRTYATTCSCGGGDDAADIANLAAAARQFSAEHRTTSSGSLSERARRLFAVRGVNSAPSSPCPSRRLLRPRAAAATTVGICSRSLCRRRRSRPRVRRRPSRASGPTSGGRRRTIRSRRRRIHPCARRAFHRRGGRGRVDVLTYNFVHKYRVIGPTRFSALGNHLKTRAVKPAPYSDC